VLCVVGLGDNVSEAQKKAYQLTNQISWNNVFFRDDIGYRAVGREKLTL
jgi:phosphoribosylamine--glycine ligase